MVPTLTVGQRVLVNRFLYHFTDPGVGDIVVFNPPKGANRCGNAEQAPGAACDEPIDEKDDDNFIKRIVAVGGDRVRIEDGIPIVNGEPVDDPNWDVRPCGAGPTCNLREEIEIPPDHYFMMGDNRGQSDDSRIWGPVPRDWVIGKAFLTYWPPGRWGIF